MMETRLDYERWEADQFVVDGIREHPSYEEQKRERQKQAPPNPLEPVWKQIILFHCFQFVNHFRIFFIHSSACCATIVAAQFDDHYAAKVMISFQNVKQTRQKVF